MPALTGVYTVKDKSAHPDSAVRILLPDRI
jgi:hypothetical protein